MTKLAKVFAASNAGSVYMQQITQALRVSEAMHAIARHDFRVKQIANNDTLLLSYKLLLLERI